MQYPKISIITPTYNAEKTITACLESVAQQNYPYLEHWIIDGLSQDNTMKIVQEYAQKYPHIKYISEKDQGIYDAMNRGIDLAEGEWLLFLGADDTLEKQIINSIFLDASNLSFDLVYGKEILGNIILGKSLNDIQNLVIDNCQPIIHYFFPHKSSFIRKKLFTEYGKYSLEYPIAADMHFFIKIISNEKVGKKFVDKIVSRAGVNGLSSSVPDKKFEQDLPYLLKEYININLNKKLYYRNFAKYFFDEIYHKNLLKGLVGIIKLAIQQRDAWYYLKNTLYWLKRRFFDK